ncbi:MAG: hypothetical protein R2860_02680 [Desulfobacterales bacterium]
MSAVTAGSAGCCHKHFQAHPSLTMVIIEKDESLIPEMESDGVLIFRRCLQRRHPDKCRHRQAKVLVAALATDVTMCFSHLTARQLEPVAFHCGRSRKQQSGKSKLLAAGANIGDPLMISARSAWLSGCCGRPGHHVSGSGVRLQPKKTFRWKKFRWIRPPPGQCDAQGFRHPPEFNLIIIAIKKPNDEMLFICVF